MEKYRTLLESFEKRGKKPLALYLHIPFCARKCAYCDFLSFPSKEEQKIAYMAKLREELEWRSRDFQKGQYEVLSLFIGGGTPSAVPYEEIEKTMEVIRNCYPIYSDWEASIECNPESASKEALEAYQRSGINRLSFGLQSTQEEELRFLGREHHFSTFLTAYQEARKLGFKNINIDLMNGIPLQTPESYKRTLKNISLLKPEHLSIYNLIIEKGTRFYALAKEGKLPIPSEEELLEMDALTKEWTGKMGMSPYEVSNYAKEGFFSVHNYGYWSNVPYLGFGIHSSSYFQHKRWKNTNKLPLYLSLPFLDEKSRPSIEEQLCEDVQVLTKEEEMEEFFYLGLRRTAGVSEIDFVKRFSVDMHKIFGAVLEKQCKEGYLLHDNAHYRFTEVGMNLSNVLLAEFLL
ncbi:radical SAM family heme chaperone HemW [Oribacterium sinus]|uniref:radical SAM family heme chaperone HemW n=1 Tax=Oribacterium sinus TaxID=237576 RepID=UPI0028D33E3D|nr:radical SAM family heme chaperone HemW [Oribacterium sinus]